MKIVTDLELFSQKPQILDIDILDIRVLNVKPGKHGMLIASAKSWSARGASHQPAFMSGCLTISHTCLPCPPGKGSLLC